MIKRTFAVTALALSATALSLVGFAGVASATSYPQPSAKVGVATNTALPAAVKSARFVNQNGTPETLGALKGRTVFLVPFLTLCGDTCPFTTGNLLQLQAKLTAAKASNVEVVAISVDPFRDTQARISAYSKLIGANFQIWTETGSTTTPYITDKEFASKNPVGKGDINANLTALEKFFGWTVQVVPQSVPAPTDWMAPTTCCRMTSTTPMDFGSSTLHSRFVLRAVTCPHSPALFRTSFRPSWATRATSTTAPSTKVAGRRLREYRQSNGSPTRSCEQAAHQRREQHAHHYPQ